MYPAPCLRDTLKSTKSGWGQETGLATGVAKVIPAGTKVAETDKAQAGLELQTDPKLPEEVTLNLQNVEQHGQKV